MLAGVSVGVGAGVGVGGRVGVNVRVFVRAGVGVCASAMANHAVLYTHDEDLKGLENVEYLPKSTVQIQP